MGESNFEATEIGQWDLPLHIYLSKMGPVKLLWTKGKKEVEASTGIYSLLLPALS